MTSAQFETLVTKPEEQARRDPAGYKWRVLLVAMLGNAYLGVMLLLIVGLLGILIFFITTLKWLAMKGILVAGLFLWMVIKALWVKVERPTGTVVTALQTPDLFAMIDGLLRQLGAPRFHHVLITDDFNAGVLQSPRLGIFGWHRNYLLIGLPLMKSLDVEQLKAVLAHEFGHLAKGHGQTSNWVYRQRLRWIRLMAALDTSESKGGFLFTPFLNWFAPYFNAYSFPMARTNEYEADATAVRLTSPQALAEALTNLQVIGRHIQERYWPKIHKQAEEHPRPEFKPYFSLGHFVATELGDTATQDWLDQAMTAPTTVADTHPALNDRLAAIGSAAHAAPPTPGQAADLLLGPARDGITEDFDRRWQQGIGPAWEARHREVRAARHKLVELNAQHEGGAELTLQDAYERAKLTASVGHNPDGAIEQLRALHHRAPDEHVISLALAECLLAYDDETSVTLVEQAMHADETATLKGCELLRDHGLGQGNAQEAQAWYRRMVERAQLEHAIETERCQVKLEDEFEQHGLLAETLAQLQAQLRAIPRLRQAYFLKKRVRQAVDRPSYVLGISVTGQFQIHRDKRAVEVLQRISGTVQFPGETLIINVDGGKYRFRRKFRRTEGARIV